MGGSFYRPDAKQPFATMIAAIPCPPEAREVTFEVGVADGDWRSEITFDCHANRTQFSRSSHLANGTTWQGAVDKTTVPGDAVALIFSYTRSDNAETRLAYERADGSVERLKEEASNSRNGLTYALMTMPLAEFKTIRKFHVQSRRYQWVEFRNVSLQLGHRTNFEVQSAGLLFPPLMKPLDETASTKREPRPPEISHLRQALRQVTRKRSTRCRSS